MVEQPEQSEKLLGRAATGLNSAAIGGKTSCLARRPLSRPRIAARRHVAAALVALHAADAAARAVADAGRAAMV